MTPAQARALAAIEAELIRLIRHDDESVVHETWIRQRYDLGAAASYARPGPRRCGRPGTKPAMR